MRQYLYAALFIIGGLAVVGAIAYSFVELTASGSGVQEAAE